MPTSSTMLRPPRSIGADGAAADHCKPCCCCCCSGFKTGPCRASRPCWGVLPAIGDATVLSLCCSLCPASALLRGEDALAALQAFLMLLLQGALRTAAGSRRSSPRAQASRWSQAPARRTAGAPCVESGLHHKGGGPASPRQTQRIVATDHLLGPRRRDRPPCGHGSRDHATSRRGNYAASGQPTSHLQFLLTRVLQLCLPRPAFVLTLMLAQFCMQLQENLLSSATSHGSALSGCRVGVAPWVCEPAMIPCSHGT